MEHTIPLDGTRDTQTGVLPNQGIAERYDIIVDFALHDIQGGDHLYFVNVLEHRNGKRPHQPVPLGQILSGRYNGDPCVEKFFEFRVKSLDPAVNGGGDSSMDPRDFEPGKKTMIPVLKFSVAELQKATFRKFRFVRNNGGGLTPWAIKTDNGDAFTMDPRRLSAAPDKESLEIWRIENGGNGWSHPVHIHFTEGRILRRGNTAPPTWEQGARKDIYRVGRIADSESSVDIALRFRDFTGTYMMHCHNTTHEDSAMLLRWDIQKQDCSVPILTAYPSYYGVQYLDTFTLPTFKSGLLFSNEREDLIESLVSEEDDDDDFIIVKRLLD